MERIQVNHLNDAELWPIVMLDGQGRVQVSGVSIEYSVGCFIEYSGTSKTSYAHRSTCLNGASVVAYIISSEKRSSSVPAMINGKTENISSIKMLHRVYTWTSSQELYVCLCSFV